MVNVVTHGTPGEKRAYVTHVVSLIGAAVAILAAIGAETASLLPVAGALMVAAGVAAFVGRRSLLQPRGMRGRIDSVSDPADRRRLEQASGLMMGVLLVFFGVVALGFGLYITLS